MLPPEARQVAVDLLRPPSGYRLEFAVLTTYSLDLDTLLALPLAVLAQADQGVEQLLADPLLILTALREAAGRIHVFVDQGGIAVPTTARPLFAMLESSVHPVRAPNGGAFHPKVWVARFTSDSAAPVLRAAVLSRNLTFDRSWDIALASESAERQPRPVPESADLSRLVRDVASFARLELQVPKALCTELAELAEEIGHTEFPSPNSDGFSGTLEFKAFGLTAGLQRLWKPLKGGQTVLAIAPFVNKTALESVAACGSGRRILVSRQDSLDALARDPALDWSEVLVLREAAQGEAEDGHAGQAHGLHAKLVVVEQQGRAHWFVGSANLTAAAYSGANVELVATVVGAMGGPDGKTGAGIARFAKGGFLDRMCEPYQRRTITADTVKIAAQKALDAALAQLLQADMRIHCMPDGDVWLWRIDTDSVPPADLRITAWPIAAMGIEEQLLADGVAWRLPLTHLTAFAGFRVAVDHPEVDDACLTLKLPASGLPDDRVARVLRSLIDTPDRLLQYLRALLGGLEGLVDWSTGAAEGGASAGAWAIGSPGDSLLDDLMRAASRDPDRLDVVRKLLADLATTDEGRQLVPPDLLAIWRSVEKALAGEEDQ